jgi:hypothetical protein
MSYILLHLFGQLIGSRLAVFSNLNNGLQSWSLPLVVMENASSPQRCTSALFVYEGRHVQYRGEYRSTQQLQAELVRRE